MILRIRYRSGEDEVSERVISNPEVEPPNMIHAHCHLRGEKRSFSLSRIEKAVDFVSGKIIEDVWQYFGLPSRKPLPATMPTFPERPNPMPTEKAQQQRKAEKLALFRPFRFLVIAEVRRTKLWALFDNRCYRCKSPEALELDHHIPQYLGGRLVPGNIVVLCSRCNLSKGESHPRSFY
ncbi:MAG: HNH endonuclease [Propionivibrio sp.]|nr:HNH endonuclease [Propionivibrio sp.]